jgi:hypothetical protein
MKPVPYDPQTYRILEPGKGSRQLIAVGVIALAVSCIGLALDRAQFFHSYLTAIVFWITIGLGGLFFILLHHLAGSVWSVVVRRIAENIMLLLPLLGILFIPVFFGLGDLYEWTDKSLVTNDHILQWKASYLNVGFFVVRTVVYFLIWTVLSYRLYHFSRQQDEQQTVHFHTRMRKISAPGMILFAFTITFAAFDWLMSLDAHWYSTIFGVYIFTGTFLAILSFLVLYLRGLQSKGILGTAITVEHYHDIGKLLFAFTVFWAYIAGSQYFLIWYGNIPEETIWFIHRWEGSWKIVSLALVAFHFTVPFFVLLFRSAKRHPLALGSMAALILLMHWFDVYWLVQPNLHTEGASLSWMDLTITGGLGTLLLGWLWHRLCQQPLVPLKDHHLQQSIDFINA